MQLRKVGAWLTWLVLVIPANAGAIPSDASTQNQVTEANGLEVQIDGPDEDNDGVRNGRVFCTLYDGGRCEPINRTSCTEGDGRKLDLVLTYTDQFEDESRMYVFVTTGDCTFAENQEPDDAPLESHDLTDGEDMVEGTGGTFDFPADFGGGDTYNSVQGIIDAIDACGEDGIQDQRYRLCIAVSPSDGDVADSAIESDDPYVYLTFLVDTVVPATPQDLTLEIGDGRFRGSVITDDDDISDVVIRYRVAEDGLDEVPADADCSTWESYDESEHTKSGDSDDATDFTVDDLDNGLVYEVCAGARDIAGNLGGFSAVQRVRTRNECDFIECYPGDPPTGYCGAGGSAGSLLLVAGAFAALRRSRKLT